MYIDLSTNTKDSVDNERMERTFTEAHNNILGAIS
jgi:hypothetical protein